MEVVLSKYAGACYGVQRALDLAESAIACNEPAVTLGPIIHNPQVVARLAAQGIESVDDLDGITDKMVIIRSHGVTPEVKEDIVNRGLELVDATCPHVARAQVAAAKLAKSGCLVVVVGEEGHPEVEGLSAYARKEGARVVVVATPDDLPEDLTEPLGVVVQTTQRREAFESVLEAIQARGLNPEVSNTICFATRQRQDAAAQLSTEVDAMVVIGGRNSSNTTRLYEICQASCKQAHHIESIEEIDPAWFNGCQKVGVTAGASTPEDQIRRLVLFLESL